MPRLCARKNGRQKPDCPAHRQSPPRRNSAGKYGNIVKLKLTSLMQHYLLRNNKSAAIPLPINTAVAAPIRVKEGTADTSGIYLSRVDFGIGGIGSDYRSAEQDIVKRIASLRIDYVVVFVPAYSTPSKPACMARRVISPNWVIRLCISSLLSSRGST